MTPAASHQREPGPGPLHLLAGRPGAPWLTAPGQVGLTRDEAARRVRAEAEGLRRAGLRPGDRAGWWPTPEAESILAALALLEAGAELLLLPRREELRTLALEARRLELRLAVAPPLVAEGLPCPAWRPGHPLAPAGTGAPAGRPRRVVLRSSGSQGAPRWICHPLENLLIGARAVARHLRLSPVDQWALSLPLDHVGGFAILLRSLVAGCRLRLPVADTAPAPSAPGDTLLSLVPTQLRDLLTLGPPTPGLRAVLLGGAPLSAALRREAFQAGWPLISSYGATESGAALCASPPGGDEEDAAGCGHSLPPHRLRLDSEGRIELASPCLFEARLDAAGRPRERREAWWRSGDLGRWRRGSLVILGRVDRLINSGGEKIRPEEVEEALLALPGLCRVAVVPVFDERFGQRPVAFVDWGANPTRDLPWVRDRLAGLARHKHPVRLWPWPMEEKGLKPNLARLVARAAILWEEG
ncbi:MAG: AMP-binding protein [bacterium]|nr:AMP-binding protein [bacterium]